MAAFVTVEIDVHDPQGFQACLDGFMPISQRFGGKRRITSRHAVDPLEGDWSPRGLVVLEFPDIDSARAWKHDPAHVALSEIRDRTADTKMVLVDGF